MKVVEATMAQRKQMMKRVGLGLLVAAAALGWMGWTAAQADTPKGEPAASLSNVYGNYLSGLHAESLSDYPQAAAFLDAALAQQPGNDRLRAQAFRVNLGAGHMDRVLELAGELHASDPTLMPTATYILGLDAMRREQWDQALAYLEETRDGRLDVLLQLALAWAAAGQGDMDKALEAVEPIRGAFAGIADLVEGMIRQRFGDLDGAEAAYMAQVADPMEAPSLLLQALVRLRLQQDRFDEARELLTRYMARHADQTELEDDMAVLMKSHALPPLATDPAAGVAEGMYQIAIPYSRQSWEGGLTYLRIALWLNPAMDKARILIGGLLEERDLFDQAIATYRGVDDASPYSWQARILVASNLYEVDQKEDSIETLEKLALDRPDRIEALRSLGQIYHSEQNYKDMGETYGRLIHRLKGERPDHWLYYYLRGMALERQKEWEDAEADFLKALDLQPDQPEVLNYLGYSWVDMGRNLDEALGMLKKAVDQRYTGYIVDSLGWAYYRLGKYRDAVRELERAVSLEPTEAVINDHLGDAYWKVGRKREARYQWERASKLESKEIDPEAIADKIKNGLPGE